MSGPLDPLKPPVAVKVGVRAEDLWNDLSVGIKLLKVT